MSATSVRDLVDTVEQGFDLAEMADRKVRP